MQWFVLIFLLVSLLQAVEATPQEIESIRTEAILFVVIFSVMSIISIVVSKRQAKKYEKEKGLTKKEKPEDNVPQADPIADRIVHLQKLVDDKLLTQEEFEILKMAKEAAK